MLLKYQIILYQVIPVDSSGDLYNLFFKVLV